MSGVILQRVIDVCLAYTQNLLFYLPSLNARPNGIPENNNYELDQTASSADEDLGMFPYPFNSGDFTGFSYVPWVDRGGISQVCMVKVTEVNLKSSFHVIP